MTKYFQDYFTRRYMTRGYFGPTSSTPGDVTIFLDLAPSDSIAYSLIVSTPGVDQVDPNKYGRRKTWLQQRNEVRNADIILSGARSKTGTNYLSVWSVNPKPTVLKPVSRQEPTKISQIPLVARITKASTRNRANSITIDIEADVFTNCAKSASKANGLGPIKKVSNPTDADMIALMEMFS